MKPFYRHRVGSAAWLPPLLPGSVGPVTAADYQALGAKLDSEVGNVVANCRLEAAADAMLHVVIADLLAAAAVLQGKSPGTPAAADQAVTPLNDYARHFDHRQWKPLK